MLDNSMPGMTGLEVARMLRVNLPQTKIVFLTLDPGIRDVALATGAVAHQLPRRVCELRACVLIEFGRTQATLAMADSLDDATEREAKDMLGGIELRTVPSTLTDVRESLRRAYVPQAVPLVAVPQA